MNSDKKPNLHFSQSGNREGFTTAGVMAYADLIPAVVVRELIQNALDAVREDGREETVIQFEIEKTKLADVPEIETYKNAFQNAKECQEKISNGKLGDQALKVVNAMEACLEQDEVETLFVLDNGMGLDSVRMSALLSDGITGKTGAGAGAIGNGHMTAVPASDLRYVLYGGVNNGNKIASGHAILASFEKDNAIMSKDGYFVEGVKNDLLEPYKYVTEGAIPNLINDKLDQIKTEFKSGSVITIPAFNRFREHPEHLWQAIQEAAACNFFLAISEGHLKIVYKDEGEEQTLDQSNIEKVFEGEIAQKKTAKHFLSGYRAAEAYKTAIHGERYTIELECGNVEVRIRPLDNGGKSRTDLCRNGMWITNYLPRFHNRFSDYKPFHCLILVTAQDGEIHRLIRASEGPLHNDIDGRKWLKPQEKITLEDTFGEIAKFIKRNLEELEQDTFDVSDILSIMSEGKIRKFEPVPHSPTRSTSPGGEEEGGGGAKNGKGGSGDGESGGAFKRSGNPVYFGALPVPVGARSRQVLLRPEEDLKSDAEAEIRFLLDEGIDETCDRTNDEQYVRLSNVKLDGAKVSDEKLIKKDKEVLAVRLPQFEKGQELVIDFDFKLPKDINLSDEEIVVLKTEIVRRKADKDKQKDI